MFALHNATLLWRALPQDLTKPKPLYKDCFAFHKAVAAELHVSQKKKRAETQEKRKATLTAKKAQKRKREEAMDAEDIIESEEDGNDEHENHNGKRHKS